MIECRSGPCSVGAHEESSKGSWGNGSSNKGGKIMRDSEVRGKRIVRKTRDELSFS